ncbi:MAG: hypothetical protein LBH07_05660 [Treponema sp.]|jgi:hypothetical protein|nr:hypothetical protein [Treponema sp.]
MKRRNCWLVLLFVGAAVGFTQSPPAESSEQTLLQESAENIVSENKDSPSTAPAGQTPRLAPQWVKDLRRGEIVFFGSFPFTVFFSATFMDLYRSAANNWDTRYAPWPVKSAGAVTMTTDELKLMFTIAVSASLVISLADHFIVRHRRKANVTLE